jgi:hypothetical protein
MGEWHVLHFIGHQEFDAARDGGLALVTELIPVLADSSDEVRETAWALPQRVL